MIGDLIEVDIVELIRREAWEELRAGLRGMGDPDLAELMIDLPVEEEGIVFRLLPRERASAVFSYLPVERQEELLRSLSNEQTRQLLAGMNADDRVRLLEDLPAGVMRALMELLDPEQLRTTRDLMGYPPNTVGREMTPSYVALRPAMTVGEALEAIRRSPRTTETLSVVYVVDDEGRLLSDLRLATLVRADPGALVGDLKDRPPVALSPRTDREEAVRDFEKYDRIALPVVDESGQMLGIVTVDDFLDVAREEATEDMLKLGGVEAMDTPYTQAGFFELLRKRAGWLSALFLGEMLTATAMGHFEEEIQRAVVLALFVPLIISSGGNSGSQATTLIIRALALGDIGLRDWWRVMRQELASGAALGTWLGGIGFLRVIVWQSAGWVDYGPHYLLVGTTVWLSLIGVVSFGTLAGSMLPFLLKRLGFDPATSSAPFVATLVDVTGLVIYFTVAMAVLSGTVL